MNFCEPNFNEKHLKPLRSIPDKESRKQIISSKLVIKQKHILCSIEKKTLKKKRLAISTIVFECMKSSLYNIYDRLIGKIQTTLLYGV